MGRSRQPREIAAAGHPEVTAAHRIRDGDRAHQLPCRILGADRLENIGVERIAEQVGAAAGDDDPDKIRRQEELPENRLFRLRSARQISARWRVARPWCRR